MNVKLKTPGDKVVYKVDLVNEGSINAKIDEIVKTTTPNYISFKVYMGNTGNDELSEGYVLGKETRIPLRIEIEFKKNITKDQLPTEARTIGLSYGVTFVQTDEDATSSGQTPTTACTTFEKKDAYNVGDEIALCNNDTGKSEDFYVISDNGDTVTALAKYNLLVGNEIEYENLEDFNVVRNDPIDPSTPGYGLQISSARGAVFDNTVRTGTIAFAEDKNNGYGYWYDTTTSSFKSNYVTIYPVWVFDSNSLLWQPVQSYQTYLRGLGYSDVTVTLPSYNDITTLGCDGSSEYSCRNAPSWVYSTSYWLGSAYNNRFVWGVDSGAGFLSNNFSYDRILGFRPVITISKTDLQ